MAAGFKKVYKANNVAFNIDVGVFNTVPYTCLSSKVNYLIEFFPLKYINHLIPVLQINSDKSIIWIFCLSAFLLAQQLEDINNLSSSIRQVSKSDTEGRYISTQLATIDSDENEFNLHTYQVNENVAGNNTREVIENDSVGRFLATKSVIVESIEEVTYNPLRFHDDITIEKSNSSECDENGRP